MKFILVAFLATSMVLSLAFAKVTGSADNLLQRSGDCEQGCNAWYPRSPACASNNSCIRLFTNSCAIKRENCLTNPALPYREIPMHYCNDIKNPKECM